MTSCRHSAPNSSPQVTQSSHRRSPLMRRLAAAYLRQSLTADSNWLIRSVSLSTDRTRALVIKAA